MPLLSIVVPVYNVEPYIRECLESIVRSDVDLEVIVVDDRSPDHSARIVQEFVDRDTRVRLIRLDENVGLGPARNVGFEASTGEYVLFLDSDDVYTRGALRSIASATSSGSDLIIFDYQRLYWNNRRERNNMAWLFKNQRGPTTLEQRPELLRLLNVSWNKAYRRQFLVDTGLQHPPGYYEDIPFTYPALGLATSITLLDRVCIDYRQRRQGSILRTSSSRHFEIFDQFDRLFDTIDAHPALERWRAPIWDRCASHIIAILAHGERRIAPDERRRFFAEASASLSRHLPEGHEPGGGSRDTKVKLILADQYGVFSSLKAANRGRIAVRNQARKVWKRNDVRETVHKGLAKLPLDPELAVFSSLWDRPPSGNPLAIYEAMREHAPDLRGVWIVRPADRHLVPDGFEIVAPNTRRYLEVLARGTYFVNDVNFPTWWVKRPGQSHLQTQHGTPLKFMGLDLQKYPTAAKGLHFGALMTRVDKWDFNLSSNSFSTEVWTRAFPSNYETLEYGYPRNDVLVNSTAADCEAARARVGVPAGRRVFLYMPTHRDGVSSLKLGLDLARVRARLDEPVTFLIRGHYFYDTSRTVQDMQAAGELLDMSSYPSVEDLYLASDVLITDYSSAQFDFANLGRPIIIHAHDWDDYRATRGTYFDITRDSPGQVTTTVAELVDAINTGAYDNSSAQTRLQRFRTTFCEFDDGRAAKRVVDRFFLGRDVEPPGSVHGPPAPLRTWTDERSG